MGFKVGELVYIKDRFHAHIVIGKAPKKGSYWIQNASSGELPKDSNGNYASFTSKQLKKI